MIFIIRLHILFFLILGVLCSPPPLFRGIALFFYLCYFRFFITRYRGNQFGRQPQRASLRP
jgi:hypothetical protein